VPPTSHVLARESGLRPDHAGSSLPREDALGNAPDPAAGLFRVPKVIG
jgi:aspartyl-tRNA(Asn)/glutamyl-tRNA(Gln) amidotransferase subunit C